MQVIDIAAVVIKNPLGQILSVRKTGTTAFMLPGGKLEAGERGVDTARREIEEELGLTLAEDDLRHVGKLSAPAANEPDTTVFCEVFEWSGELEDLPAVQAEIAEARWFDATSEAAELAPLSREVVFPLFR